MTSHSHRLSIPARQSAGSAASAMLLGALCVLATTSAMAICDQVIPASTPSGNFQVNADGTVLDRKSSLQWKRCAEGVGGPTCDLGAPPPYQTWLQALQRVKDVNQGGGFAGYTDWRLPNIKELASIVEEQCYGPAFNPAIFPNANEDVWSSSPFIDGGGYNAAYAWSLTAYGGTSVMIDRGSAGAVVRLVRDAQ